MKNTKKGSALIGVLMIIAVLTLLVSTLLNTTILQTRLIQSRQNQILAFNAAEAILFKIEQEIKTVGIPCKRQPILINSHFQMPTPTCETAFHQSKVNYFVEDLGVFPCLRIINKKSNQPAQIYRITVQAKSIDTKTTTTLQSTLAIVANSNAECEKTSQIIQAGRLSWIELI